jgi:hypothetical protein
MVEHLADSKFFVCLWENSRRHDPLVIIPFISGKVEKLKK